MQQRDKIKLGIVQQKPAYLDLAKSMDLAMELGQRAIREATDLLVFGETWLTGYPAWLDHLPGAALWQQPQTDELFSRMLANALLVPGPDTDRFSQLARAGRMHIVLGCTERVDEGPGQGTLYNSLLIFDAEGELVVHHRKLMPTFSEKLLYGLGDGEGLRTVSTPFGKISGLICWEHWMPLTRQAMHDAGEHIHIALWPAVNDLHQLASRHYAFEGQAYVVAVGQILQVKDLPAGLDWPAELAGQPDHYLLNGGSAIIAPDTSYVLPPQYERDELIFHEITDLDATQRGRIRLDVSGHYQRPDVFELKINKERWL